MAGDWARCTCPSAFLYCQVTPFSPAENGRNSSSPSALLGLHQCQDQADSNPQFFASSATRGTRRPPVWLDLSAPIWPFRWMTIIPSVCTTLLHFPNIFGLQSPKGESQAQAPGPDSGMNQWSSQQGGRAKAWWRLGEHQDSPSRVSFLFLNAFLPAIKFY